MINTKHNFKINAPLAGAVVLFLLAPQPLEAGIMSHLIDQQTYRDFAENRGVFAAGATNVDIYDKQGNYVGTIDRVMNFDSVADIGAVALAGGPGFVTTVAHNGPLSTITFAERFGATKDTAFYDSYNTITINNATSTGGNSNYDYRVQRLSKIVTEATSVSYLTDQEYLDNMVGKDLVRVGSGAHTVAYDSNTAENVSGAYQYLTGGTFSYTGQSKHPGRGEQDIDEPMSYDFYTYSYQAGKPGESSPLHIGANSGDSGSPTFFYNEKTGQWEFVAAHQASGGVDGYGRNHYQRCGNLWAADLVSSYDKRIVAGTDGGDITWTAANGNGIATITQGGHSTSMTVLKQGQRGDTSTAGVRATDAQLDDCLNLIFEGGGRIVIGSNIDTGAGSLTFNDDFILSDGGNSSLWLNSAGYIINKGATLLTTLTGGVGDEWRKIGEGTLIISGSGNNLADLNVGGTGLTILDRSVGYAARNVKINGGEAVVRTNQAGQISGNIIFGHRGGTLDLYGNDMSLDEIVHLDSGATFANYKANQTATLTFSGSGEHTYLGQFKDGGSASKGLLNIVYNPDAGSGSVWKLSGTITNKGTWTINGGEVKIEGTHTLHAGGYIDENDWQTAKFDTGLVIVESGAQLTAGIHSEVSSHVHVNSGGTYRNSGGFHSGNVNLDNSNFTAAIGSGTGIESGVISGNGNFNKTGQGTLVLANAGNTFTGTKTINEGFVHAGSFEALGGGTGNWLIKQEGVMIVDGASFESVKSKLDASSSGTYALSQSRNSSIDISGMGELFLGAVGTVSLGTQDTLTRLDSWATGGGWKLGGGEGTLTMHLKLSGTDTLHIGNGSNKGKVVLTNTHNSDDQGGFVFSGRIIVNKGASLDYTDARALGTGTGHILINQGAQLALGSTPQAVLQKVDTSSSGLVTFTGNITDDYNMSALGFNSLYIGTNGAATFSGKLTAGANGYLFGGSGTINVSSDLTGSTNLKLGSADASESTTLILTGNNNYTGVTRIMNGSVLQVGNGGSTGSIGRSYIVNDGQLVVDRSNEMSIYAGISGFGSVRQQGTGRLILEYNNTYSGGTIIASGTLQVGTGGSSGDWGTGDIINNGTFNINLSSNRSLDNQMSGTGQLVKDGTGRLILSTQKTYTGGTVVNNGILEIGKAGGGYMGIIRGSLTINQGGQAILTKGDSLGYDGNATCVTEINMNGGNLHFADTGNQTFQRTVFNLKGGSITGANRSRMDLWHDAVVNVLASDEGTTISGVTVLLRASNSTIFNVADGAAAADLTVHSNIVNNAQLNSFTKTGAGTMVLLGDNTYSGTTIINQGTLQIGNGGTAGKLGSGSVSNYGTLEINRSNHYALSNNIMGYGTLVKNGTGTLTVSKSNTSFGGRTEVKQGELVIAASNALGYGHVVVHNNAVLNTGTGYYLGNSIYVGSGGILTGRGSIGGSVTIAANGVFSPGAGIGSTILYDSSTFESRSIYDWQVRGSHDADYDQILVYVGTLDIRENAVLRINLLDTDFTDLFWEQDRSFDCVVAQYNASIEGIFSLDTSLLGDYSSLGSWSIARSDDNMSIQVQWSYGVLIPESSTASFLLAVTAFLSSRRRRQYA